MLPCPIVIGRSGSTRHSARGDFAVGLRQNLNVMALEGGRYEVVAGGRRLRALKKLAKAGAVAKDVSVPCLVLGEGDDPAEISLVENMVRVAMRPCDQFEVFKGLIDGKGMTIETVAERFGVRRPSSSDARRHLRRSTREDRNGHRGRRHTALRHNPRL
ncbi:ParB/Srx family N-terminal domain-containing protein [Bosea vestrisii]|uniref:ParB/Srx family N-terminal domain-containing protein n=1 Tax=Bosea vestrisii TaxID=151416 RepID=UPI003D76A031